MNQITQLRSHLIEWSKHKSLAVRSHADIVAANLRVLERDGWPDDPITRMTFADNVRRLERVALAR